MLKRRDALGAKWAPAMKPTGIAEWSLTPPSTRSRSTGSLWRGSLRCPVISGLTFAATTKAKALRRCSRASGHSRTPAHPGQTARSGQKTRSSLPGSAKHSWCQRSSPTISCGKATLLRQRAT
jgi:hypothetical protein